MCFKLKIGMYVGGGGGSGGGGGVQLQWISQKKNQPIVCDK